MDYQQLHQRYGSHIAKRVRAELGMSEFALVDLEKLPAFLETRAVVAQKEYQMRLDNPMNKRFEDIIDHLHRRWRAAEELAYLISVTEDVGLGRNRLKIAN